MPASSSSTATLHRTENPWRPWSLPIPLQRMRNELHGLLNKVTDANLDPIAHRIGSLAIAVEQTDDADILDAFVRIIYQHASLDPMYTSIYVAICQRILDKLERERDRWRKVELYHLGNPVHCFETSLQSRCQQEFEAILDTGDAAVLCTFASFVGGLLADTLLFPTHVETMVDALFKDAVDDVNGSLSALCRFLAPVIASFKATELLNSLGIDDRAQAALVETETHSPRVWFTMKNILEETSYPRPHDAFSSSRYRREIYELDPPGSNSEVSSISDDQDEDAELLQANEQKANQLILYRDNFAAVDHLENLDPEDRHTFLSTLISAALSTGDLVDAQAVARFLTLREVRGACDMATFSHGFEAELSALADTIIDVPHAAQLLAVMLQGSPLPPSTVQSLSSIVRENKAPGQSHGPVTERLLETYSALIQSPGSRSGFTSAVASVEDLTGRMRTQDTTYWYAQ